MSLFTPSTLSVLPVAVEATWNRARSDDELSSYVSARHDALGSVDLGL